MQYVKNVDKKFVISYYLIVIPIISISYSDIQIIKISVYQL